MQSSQSKNEEIKLQKEPEPEEPEDKVLPIQILIPTQVTMDVISEEEIDENIYHTFQNDRTQM